jgi:hypothetical protein
MIRLLHAMLCIGLLLLTLAADAVTPADIPGLALWVRADAGVTVDEAGRLAAWADPDRDNGFVQANAACRPILAPQALNGLPVVRFDGKDPFLQLRTPIQVGEGAVFIVARWDATCLDGSARYLLGADTGTNGYLISDGRGRVLGTAGKALYQNGARVLNGRIGFDPRIFPLANAPLSAFNLITVSGNTRPNERFAFLGQNGQNRSRTPFLGDVAEVLVYTQPLTPAQVRAVEGYLGGKYFNWPAAITVPVAMTADEMQSIGKRMPIPAFHTVNPLDSANGVLRAGIGEKLLSPGRYRLHLNLHLPANVPNLRAIVRVNTTARTVRPGEQNGPLTLDFTQDALTAADLPLVRIAWTTDPDPDAIDPAQRGDNPANAIRMMRLDDLAATQHLLTIGNPYIERLCPIAVTAVTADKVRYMPGEKGMLRATVRNLGADITGVIRGVVLREVADTTVILPPTPLVLNGGEARTLEIPFTTTGRWGAGARVTVAADGLEDSADEAFTVSANPFEAGIGVDLGSALHAGLKRYPAAITRARRLYATWLDLPGWSPGECAQLVPETPTWWSAVSAREDDAGLKELVTLAHGQGIAAVAGVSLNPAGPPARALATAHPDWFLKGEDGAPKAIGGWDPDALAGWNDPAWRKRHVHPGDMALAADWNNLAFVAHVKNQLTESAKRYGWDALRLEAIDGQTPERLRALLPGRLALTSDAALPTARLPELNGGIYLRDGLRFWLNGDVMYRDWGSYLAQERANAARVRAAGGHYYARLNTAFLPPAQAYYKLVYSLIAGIHPADEIDAPGCANWGVFLTRWSSMLWDPALRDVDPKARVSIHGSTFQPLLTERSITPTRKCVILHLVTPPAAAAIAEVAFPPRPSHTAITYHPEPGTRVLRATIVRPESAPFDLPLILPKTGAQLAVLPPLGHWAMVIWEVETVKK